MIKTLSDNFTIPRTRVRVPVEIHVFHISSIIDLKMDSLT